MFEKVSDSGVLVVFVVVAVVTVVVIVDFVLPWIGFFHSTRNSGAEKAVHAPTEQEQYPLLFPRFSLPILLSPSTCSIFHC